MNFKLLMYLSCGFAFGLVGMNDNPEVKKYVEQVLKNIQEGKYKVRHVSMNLEGRENTEKSQCTINALEETFIVSHPEGISFSEVSAFVIKLKDAELSRSLQPSSFGQGFKKSKLAGIFTKK